MHRIFVIAELLREIALYLGPNEWVALSSASRSWNLVVLPILWRRVDFGVFCAFGSFDYDSDSGCYTEFFEHARGAESDSAMVRFRRNSIHVKEFSAGYPICYYGATGTASREVSRVLSQFEGPLFPRMETLRVTFDCLVPVLSSPSVKCLDLALEAGSFYNDETLRSMVDRIVAGFPMLRSIRIQGGATVIVEYEATFIDLFTHLPMLEEVWFPQYGLTPTMFCAIARVLPLKNIGINPSGRGLLEAMLGRRSITSRWATDHFVVPAHGYSNLRQLQFSLPDIAYSIDFFKNTGVPFARLEDLCVSIAFPQTVTDGDVEQLFDAVQQRCPDIEVVELFLYPECMAYHDLFGIRPLSLASVKSMARFHRLRNLTIRHSLPLLLTDDDVETIALALPFAECLRLNEHPLLLTNSQLTVSALYRVAQYCSRIQIVGLYFDCREPAPSTSMEQVPFSSTLLKLLVGASPFYVPATSEALWLVATTLEHLLPDHTELVTSLEEAMYDSREFTAGIGRVRFVVARNGLMEAFDLGWRTAHCMAKSFRMWRQEWRREAFLSTSNN